MNTKSVQIVSLLCAGIVLLLFVKMMHDMSANMAQMTEYVGSLANDVSAMKSSMDGMAEDMSKMSQSMQRIDASFQGMGTAAEQGGKIFKQWDPTQMMR